MPRKRARGEIGVTAGILSVLAGCASVVPNPDPRAPAYAAETSPPETLDYLGALTCGGLAWALQAVQHDDKLYSEHYAGQAGLFLQWAEVRAREAGQDANAAKRDMTALRDGILATAGGTTGQRKSDSIDRQYRGEVRACNAMAYDPAHAFVVIGG